MLSEVSVRPSSFDEETDRDDMSANALLDRAFGIVLLGEGALGPEDADRVWDIRMLFEGLGMSVEWLQPCIASILFQRSQQTCMRGYSVDYSSGKLRQFTYSAIMIDENEEGRQDRCLGRMAIDLHIRRDSSSQ